MNNILPWFALLGLAACGNDEPTTTPAPAQSAAPAPADHGEATELGTLVVAGRKFLLTLLGEAEPGVECAFEVRPVGATADELAGANLYLWVESRDGTQLSAASKGLVEGDALHFHAMPRKGDKQPYRAVLRLREGGTDERASLPLDGHGHEHPEGPHHGVPVSFAGGDATGQLELKLHDDRGDLELWLYADAEMSRPFDLPLSATVEVELVDVGGRRVTLRPRNQEQNEDEDGTPNVRDGATNYFVYPSVGEDAAFLQGKAFQSIAVVRFSRDGASYASEELVLAPHAH